MLPIQKTFRGNASPRNSSPIGKSLMTRVVNCSDLGKKQSVSGGPSGTSRAQVRHGRQQRFHREITLRAISDCLGSIVTFA